MADHRMVPIQIQNNRIQLFVSLSLFENIIFVGHARFGAINVAPAARHRAYALRAYGGFNVHARFGAINVAPAARHRAYALRAYGGFNMRARFVAPLQLARNNNLG